MKNKIKKQTHYLINPDFFMLGLEVLILIMFLINLYT